MNLLYCGDKNIADGLMMSLISITDHNPEPVNAYVLTMGVTTEKGIFEPLDNSFAEFMDKFLKKKNPQSSFTLIDMTQEFLKDFPAANAQTRFTPGCMLRLFADSVSALPSKLLYLDNDVLCRGRLAPLYNTDMSDTELAGTLDYYGRWFFRNNIFRMDYLNSGVLLLNMDKIRQTGLFTRCRHRCASKQMFMPDQSALNKLAVSKKILPRKFNEQRKLKADTVLQHFTTSFRFFPCIHTVTVKPWQIDKVRSVLGLDCYDELYDRFMCVKKEYTEYKAKENGI